MLGFLFGIACLVGFFAVWRGRHRLCGDGPGAWTHRFSTWHGHGAWHEPGVGRHVPFGFGERTFLRAVSERLGATPGQEKVLASAFEELRDAVEHLRRDVGKTREDVARAVRGAVFDETLLGETFARHDEAIEALRRAFVGAMAKVHDALEDEQRERFARLVELGPLHGWGGGMRI